MAYNCKTLADLAVGQTGTVGGIDTHAPLRRRFRELGLCDGESVTCLFCTPRRDIAVYKICGAQIALRDCDARTIRLGMEGTL